MLEQSNHTDYPLQSRPVFHNRVLEENSILRLLNGWKTSSDLHHLECRKEPLLHSGQPLLFVQLWFDSPERKMCFPK